jgi:hypothetical protein
MTDNIYFNCNLFMELLDQHVQLQQKFSSANEEIFNGLGGSFATATHKLASNPVTMESAQALMMCWSAIRTLRQEQRLLSECADRLISYLAQTRSMTPESINFAVPQEKQKRGGGKERVKRAYTPRKSAKQQAAAAAAAAATQEQEQQLAESFLKETDRQTMNDLQQLLDHVQMEKAAAPEEDEAAAPKNFYFDPEQDGSQQVNW